MCYQLECNMDSESTFARTSKGDEEVRTGASKLSGDIKRTLLLVEGEVTLAEISKRAPPSLRDSLEQMLNELVQGGFIQDKSRTGYIPKMAVPHKAVAPVKKPADTGGGNELDFASGFKAAAAPAARASNANDDAEAEAIAYSKQQAQESQQAEAIARAQAEVQARAMAEEKANARAKQDAEDRAAIDVQARALDEARARAEAQARGEPEVKGNPEAEALARINAAAEAQERAIAAAKAKLEADAKAIALAKAKLDAEAKAIAEAQAKAKAVAETKARLEAEAKARLAAEARARQELEAARAKAVPQIDDAIFQSVLKPADTILDPPDVKLEPFTFLIPDPEKLAPTAETHYEKSALRKDEAALIDDIDKFIQPLKSKTPAAAKPAGASKPKAVEPIPEFAPETIRPKETVKPAAEHKLAIDEVNKPEKAQAGVWAEAEKREKQSAKAKAMWDVDPGPQQQAASKYIPPVARAKRKPFPWFKLAAGSLVMLLIVMFAAPFVLPTRQYVPGIQQMLGAKLHQPVTIGRLEGRLLPTPRLDLVDVSIGDRKQIKARHAIVDFSAPALLTAIKKINSVELEGVEVAGEALQPVSEWLRKISADNEFPIGRILFKEGKLEAEGISLSGVGGEMNFDQSGKFSTAKLHAEGSKYALALEAVPGDKARVSLTVNSSALPLLPNWDFDYLIATGELSANELVITEMDSRIMGGAVTGNVRLGWRSGWRAQGSLVAKTIDMQNMLTVMSGTMDGTARFQMQAAGLAKLAGEATLDGSFILKNGVINGIDIVETASLHRTENMPGGRTHFDELTGDLLFAKDVFAFRQLKMTVGVVTARGAVDYSGQQEVGTITADLALREGTKPVALRLGGTRDNPTLVAVR